MSDSAIAGAAIQVEDIDKMRFRSDIQPQIDKWIQMKLDVVEVQKNILHWGRQWVGLTELCNPAFEDSDSLNIPCILDNNYLCRVTSCTTGRNGKKLRVVWPGGREEEWLLAMWTVHQKILIDRIHYRGVWEKEVTASTQEGGMHGGTVAFELGNAKNARMKSLLGRLKYV
jgi:hypothetical protein